MSADSAAGYSDSMIRWLTPGELALVAELAENAEDKISELLRTRSEDDKDITDATTVRDWLRSVRDTGMLMSYKDPS
jgi:hypothetical protein